MINDMDRSPHLELAKWHWSRRLEEGDVAVDATCGNGHDTLFLAKRKLSALFAIDLQQAAIDNTKRRLLENASKEELAKIFFYRMAHDDLSKLPYPKPPRLIVYNLGYLPGGDKKMTTQSESTLISIRSALSILSEKGSVSITCYPGHEEGKKEEEAIVDFVSSLPCSDWEVERYTRPNRPHSPSLLWISRLYTQMN